MHIVKPCSLPSITMHHNDHQLIPFRSSCPNCNQSLNENNAREKRIRLYCDDGSVVTGKSEFYLVVMA
jgi:hypothetical protein